MKISLRIGLLFLLSLLSIRATAKVFYIAPGGDDANPGTIELPLASVYKAQTLVSAGDTVYLRGGDYKLGNSDITKVYSNLFACYAFIDKSGTSGKRINYWAYPGEKPRFDFTDVKPANQRVVGFYVTASYIHFKGIEITGVQVTITTHTESYCFYSFGNYNIYEQLDLHDNQGTGLRHRKGGRNLILNCDAYRNHDYTSEDGRGGNTDGFGCHPSDGGTGNVFRGCRSWFNSDDGYDFIGSAEVVKIENCWSMYNGYSTSFQSLGDGNGFKAGGDAVTAVENLPVPIPRHIVRFCLAVRNKASGFYANHHIGGIDWINNTAYRNGTNYNMLNRLDDNATDVPGYDHYMRNNLGYKGGAELRNINKDECDLSNNYFDLDVSVDAGDFVSLDETLLQLPRKEDGSLPDIDFMRLKYGSDLVDKGQDVGFLFEGYYPDLGAWDQPYDKFPTANATWYQFYKPEYFQEEGNHPEYRIYGLVDSDTGINGKTYQKLFRFENDSLELEETNYAGAIREDSARKVYYVGTQVYPWIIDGEREVLLYDFGAGPGDSVTEVLSPGTGPLVVSTIDSIMVGGVARPRISFENDPYTKWIVGIGNERGILFYAEEMMANGLWSDLTCFWQDGTGLFHHPDYDQCYSYEEWVPVSISPNTGFKVYPNPGTGIFVIEGLPASGCKLGIYTINGVLVREENIFANCAELVIPELPRGVYLVLVSSESVVQTQKIIKL